MTRHAIERAKKRYGLRLTFADIEAMAAKIRAGDFERQIPTEGGMLVELEHQGQKLVACWNLASQRIVTIYPLKAVERDRRKKPVHLSKAIRAAARAEAEYEREGRYAGDPPTWDMFGDDEAPVRQPAVKIDPEPVVALSSSDPPTLDLFGE